MTNCIISTSFQHSFYIINRLVVVVVFIISQIYMYTVYSITATFLHLHTYLVSVCLSMAPEQMTCMSRWSQSKVLDSLAQMEASIEPTRLRRNLRAANNMALPCSSLGMPSCTHTHTHIFN